MPWTPADAKKHNKGIKTDVPAAQWVAVANSVLSSCMKKGGTEATCAASAIKQANGVLQANSLQTYSNMVASYVARTETVDNVEYLVAPVTMMVEGVHPGSRGNLLHPVDEFGKTPAAYNGIPITIHHPQDISGQYISANSPGTLKSWAVGKVFNAKLEKGKLKAEAWVEKARCNNLSAETLQALESGAQLEVSLGVYTDEDETTGNWNNETYIAVARNHKPDHLALLPGDVGACSIKDGCGIRVNKQFKTDDNVEVTTALQVMRESGYQISAIQVNSEMGLEQKLDSLRDLVRSLNSPRIDGQPTSDWHYLKEAYDSYLIYEKEESGNGTYSTRYFKRNYQFNVATEKAEFTSDPVEVVRTVEYKTIKKPEMEGLVRTKFNTNKKEEQTMSDVTCTPCVKQRVDQLIQTNKFCEDDRNYLETLSVERLDGFLGVKPEVQVNSQAGEKLTKEQALNALRGSLTPQDFMSLLPKETQEQLQIGLTTYQNSKKTMVDEILANSVEGSWDEASLNAMPFETLQKIHVNSRKAVAPAPESFTSLFGLQGNLQANAKVDDVPPLEFAE